MSMEETLTLKLYSPLTAELETHADYDAYYDEPDLEQLRGGDLVCYQDAILEGILHETLPEESERGLMAYFYGPESVDQKVVSLKPTVEVVHGKLYGVAECEVKEPLTKEELSALKDYCAGQYSDGNGKWRLM